MLSWFHEHHLHDILEAPFPQEWLGFLRANVAYYALLTEPEQAKLRDDLRILIADTHWEGCGGFVLTPEAQVTVAAQACLLILNRPQAEFHGLESILIYPAAYVATKRERLGNDRYSPVEERPDPRLGQATGWGTVVLAWEDVLRGAREPETPHNLVLHEFAHVLDFEDGEANGVPRIPDELLDEWSAAMTAEYDHLVHSVRAGHTTDIDAYGATDAAEFFAVLTEYFFGRPAQMRQAHPRLYDLLRRYYQQDTAARMERASPGSRP